MGRSPDITNPQSLWAKHGPAISAFVGITVLCGVAWAILVSQFELKAHAQEVYAAQTAAVAAAKSECEIRMEREIGKIHIETTEIRGGVTELKGNVARIDSTMQRIADKLGVAPVLPGFAPLASPPRTP